MAEKLSIDQAKKFLAEALDSFPHTACTTCECYLGYLTQLELDSDESLVEIFAPHKPERSRVHSCFGCDPCPPADLFSGYLRGNKLNDDCDIL
jgi:hypothetical protein